MVQIDKLSILISVLFSFLVFHEKLTPRGLAGLARRELLVEYQAGEQDGNQDGQLVNLHHNSLT